MYSHNNGFVFLLFLYFTFTFIIRVYKVVNNNVKLYSTYYKFSTVSIITSFISLILYMNCVSGSNLYNKIINKNTEYAINKAKEIDNIYNWFLGFIVVSVISSLISLFSKDY